METKEFDILILGAGAAGLMCAYYASSAGKRVAILEHNKQVGRKILISGGGRCNFTNLHSTHEDFYSENPHFCRSALARFTPQDFVKMVEDEEMAYYEKKLGQLFCKTSAKDIIKLLMKNIKIKQVELFLDERDLVFTQQHEYFEFSNNSKCFRGKKIVIASGGLSIPPIGASDIGHQIGKNLGHKIIPATPALVPLKYAGFDELKGISMVVKLTCGKDSIQEDLLFTHKGFSGPAILKISLYWQAGEKISFNWLPDLNIMELIGQEDKKIRLEKLLKKHLPNKFCDLVMEKLNFKLEIQLANLSQKQIAALENFIHNYELIPEGTEGFRKAEVTRGGVDTSKISSKTMESQLVPGVFFIGEVLDVTGQLGGHNFQWAWASAFAAGSYLAQEAFE